MYFLAQKQLFNFYAKEPKNSYRLFLEELVQRLSSPIRIDRRPCCSAYFSEQEIIAEVGPGFVLHQLGHGFTALFRRCPVVEGAVQAAGEVRAAVRADIAPAERPALHQFFFAGMTDFHGPHYSASAFVRQDEIAG
jgi:hypothetical protein